LFVVSIIERSTINWFEWFKVQLHKEMIVVQRKARKVRNSLVGPIFILMAKYYNAVEYMEEDEAEPITHLQRQKKTRKRMLQVPSIPSIGVNLVAGSSQEEFPPKEEEVVLEQAYPITKVAQERGIFQNDG
jgi:hypothetical protein